MLQAFGPIFIRQQVSSILPICCEWQLWVGECKLNSDVRFAGIAALDCRTMLVGMEIENGDNAGSVLTKFLLLCKTRRLGYWFQTLCLSLPMRHFTKEEMFLPFSPFSFLFPSLMFRWERRVGEKMRDGCRKSEYFAKTDQIRSVISSSPSFTFHLYKE